VSKATSFVEDLAERAYLREEDAHELIVDFLEALPGFVDRETWDLISAMVPIEVTVDWEQVGEQEDLTMEEFLVEMSQEEGVESTRAAEHARAVAETIRSNADPEQMERLRSTMMNEDLLALFESVRGEFTFPEQRDGPQSPP
jgi:uncharacterized protein (DUF2267 family)